MFIFVYLRLPVPIERHNVVLPAFVQQRNLIIYIFLAFTGTSGQISYSKSQQSRKQGFLFEDEGRLLQVFS